MRWSISWQPHTLWVKRDAGECHACQRVLDYYRDSLRWKISYDPHADGNDRGKPREMQEKRTPAKEFLDCSKIKTLL